MEGDLFVDPATDMDTATWVAMRGPAFHGASFLILGNHIAGAGIHGHCFVVVVCVWVWLAKCLALL